MNKSQMSLSSQRSIERSPNSVNHDKISLGDLKSERKSVKSPNNENG